MTCGEKGMNYWWGAFTLDIGECLQWRLANCDLYIERSAQQWRIYSQYIEAKAEESILIAQRCPMQLSEHLDTRYYNFEKTAPHILLTPVLADRSQVSRPEMPVYIAAHEQITFYISTPLWVRIATGKAVRTLQETPLQYLSDTWFGENTQVGELCYASRTRCRTHLDSDSLLPYRATTQVIVQNHRSDNLLIQRIKLPLPLLSLFSTQEGHLWTENLLVEANPDQQITTAIEKTTPSFVLQPKLLNPPRVSNKSSRILGLIESVLAISQ